MCSESIACWANTAPSVRPPFVYENLGLVTATGSSAPSVRPPVNPIFADSSLVVNGTVVANQYSTSTPAATAAASAPAPTAALTPVVTFAGRRLL